jgi:hypothetical protein
MQLKRFLEFKKSDLEPIKSFKMKDELNPKIWDDMKIKKEIKEDLLKISKDFFDGTDLDAEVKDIILTGSLANYNWSKYSDFDLHIIIDFKEVNKDVDLVKQLVDGKKTIWNLEHDIKISGYEVEVYIQDEKEPHMSTGVYSIMNDEWNIKPKKIDFEPNEKEIEEKSLSIMKQVDKIEEDWENIEYEEVKKRVKKVWDKVKKLRKDSLEKEGELGIGNLVFKVLRRNNYIGKIMKIKRDAYAKQFESISENQTYKFYHHDELSNKEIMRIFDFDRLDVEDTIQDIIDELDSPIAISFSINDAKLSDDELEQYLHDGSDIKCEIIFFLDSEITHRMINKYENSFSQVVSLKKEYEEIKKMCEFIENNFNKSFFEILGYKITIKKHRIFKSRRVINHHPTENFYYGDRFCTIEIRKKYEEDVIHKSINEWSDNELLNFFYELDKISKELSDESDEHSSSWLDYEFDENTPGRFCKMKIDLGFSTYSDSKHNTLELDWSEVDSIKIENTGHSSSPYGDFDYEETKNFETFDDVINYIKEGF